MSTKTCSTPVEAFWISARTRVPLACQHVADAVDVSYQTINTYRRLMACEVGRRPVTLFALVIGIDDYVNYQKLRGAVADAKAVRQYLEDVLQVPSDHIDTLYDNQATRDAIIAAFQKLRSDERINKGDPIIIFYAGHGGELTAPAPWRVKTKIQCLIPQDCVNEGTKPIPNRMPISSDRAPLPDRTLGVLIEDIAKAKGDNITVIFDCCHSASGTRILVQGEGFLVPRAVDLDFNIPENLDSQIWQGRAGKIATGFAYHGLRSHVLLAACGEKERAYEDDRRGQFTKALLTTLEDCTVNSLDLTYTEVLERIHLEKQRPQCEGVNRHRTLYGTRVPAGRQVWYPVRAGNYKGKCIVEAGLSHGVERKVVFALYNQQKLWLGVAPVDETSSIEDFETTVTTPEENVSFAKVTSIGEVPIYVGNDSALEETLQKLDGNGIMAPKFRIVREVGDARLHVAMEDNMVTFRILDQRVQRLGLTELPHKAALDTLAHVLGAAAHFFWYLDLENKKSRLGTKNEVSVNFYFLKRDYDDYGQPFLIPVEPGFFRKGPDQEKPDVIDFVVDPAGRYGIEIKNNTRRDLYLNVFLFNNSSMSIATCYAQPDPGKPEVPLKQGGTFTIGYGTGGTAPFSYSLEESQDIDVGYLKIFLSTRAIDLSDIEQMSPFSKVHPPPSRDRRDGVQPKNLIFPRADIWFTVSIPVVQRRGKEGGMRRVL